MRRSVQPGSPLRIALLLVGVSLALLLPGSVLSYRAPPPVAPQWPGAGPDPTGEVVSPAFVATSTVQRLGPLPASASIALSVGLSLSDPSGLANAIALEYAPGSPAYHHFLTPSEIADRYGPTQGAYDSAVAYFRSFGLGVSTSPDRTMLFVQGPSAETARAFDTSFESYRAGGHTFYSHPTPARLPSGIPWQGVVGLGDQTQIHPSVGPLKPSGAAVRIPSASSCPSSSWITPCLAHTAYNLTTLLNAGDNGTGTRVGVVDTYDAAETQTQLASDYSSFTTTFSLPHGNVSYVYPVPTGGNLNTTYTGWGAEEALDIEWTRAMAPGAAIDMTLAPNSNAGLYQSVDWLVAHDAVNAITMSWGENDVGVFNSFATPCHAACNASADGSYQSLHPVLEAAAAEGISVFSASGDCGAADGTNGVSTNYPASDPYVTGVGGTDLTTTSSGGYVTEGGWAGNSSGTSSPGCQNQGGSGGGYSPFPRPYWQTGPGLPASPKLRGVPDVSILGASPGAEVVISGSLTVEAGTSLSSPMWAGIAADADTYFSSSLGFLNPSLYSIARSSSASTAFHDVTTGFNGYKAGTGWDPITGVGTPNAFVLIPLLGTTSFVPPSVSVDLTASPRFGAAPLTVRFHANSSSGLGPSGFYDVGFGDGNSTVTVNGNASYSFTQPGVFAATATAFNSAGNSSLSQPVTIVVGGGRPLTVSLNVSPVHPAVGAPVTLVANATGGTAPYSYTFLFGDGTFLDGSNRSTVLHAYPYSSGFCPVVVASDALTPPDGGESSAVAVRVGTALTPQCLLSPPLTTNLSVAQPGLDLPGGFVFRPVPSGGLPPYSVTYTANDPYSAACRCPIFSTAGNHTVNATVSDSLDATATASTNVTLYPALSGTFRASVGSGTAPLLVNFSAALTGGHLANATLTHWEFGDGTNATGAVSAHTYPNPGFYVATALASDGFGGHASSAFLIDAYPSGPPPSTMLTATITPALDVPVGVATTFTAQASGALSPYRIHWSLGNNASAFGSPVNETYPYDGCGSPSTCPRSIGLEAEDATGRWLNLTIPLDPPQEGNATALSLVVSGVGVAGVTPFPLRGSALASGMPSPSISWAFGDGASAVGPYGNHTYLTPGNYTVTVRASDPYGDRLVQTRALVVSGIQRYSPFVVGNANRTSGVGPLSVRFTANAGGGAGAPYQYAWTFGDGLTGYGSAVNHTYPTPGSYLANVTATDRLGDPAILSFAVLVYATTALTLAISGLPTTAIAGSTFPLSVWEGAACGVFAVPNCSLTHSSVRLIVLKASAPPPTNATAPLLAVTPDPVGYANFSLTAPTQAGPYTVYVWSVSRGFYGNASANFSVWARMVRQPAGMDAGPLELATALTILAAGIAVVLAVVSWRGRRPVRPRPKGRAPVTPSRPRADEGARRGG
ncbi:MAG: PKD domain-containing protein [Thermoplasmata archaeon]|nr:PKD domain-containing protein [Thermoplasmata archaeon]MCI4359924.1 PKD domain-containing protein [Thermoplasmata archaeon]